MSTIRNSTTTTSATYDHTNLKKMLKATFHGNVGDWNKPVYIPVTFMNGKSVEKVWDLGDKDTDKWFAVLTSCSTNRFRSRKLRCCYCGWLRS